MKRSLAVIVCGILAVLWMVAARPAAGRVVISQSSPADQPYIMGDVSSAAWSARCFPVPMAGEESAVDPIVHWGPGSIAPHTHEFFAQRTIFSTTSPGDLISSPPTGADNCDGPTDTDGTPGCVYLSGSAWSVCDKSGYWVPELLYDLDPTNIAVTASPASTLAPAYMNIYWRNEYANPTLDTSFPEDLAMVAGDADATSPQNIWTVNWQCVSPLSADKWQTPGRYSSTVPSSCLMPSREICPEGHTYPDDCLPTYLRMVITFPECVKLTWNAVQGMYTPTAVHYGEANSPTPPAPNPHSSSSYINCPPPVGLAAPWLQIPNIQVDPHWRINNAVNSPYAPSTLTTIGPTVYVSFDLSKLLLSSDLMMDQSPGMASVTPGTTSHADYENGYLQQDIDNLMEVCFHETATLGGINCGSQ